MLEVTPGQRRTRPTNPTLSSGIAGERKLFRMNEEHTQSRMQSLRHHALVALVVLVCAWLLLHLLFHVVIVAATIVAVVVAIIGAVWAVRVLF